MPHVFNEEKNTFEQARQPPPPAIPRRARNDGGVCIYIYIYRSISYVMYVCMSVCLSVCMHVCMYVCMYVRTYVRMYVCVCVYIYIYIYHSMYVCVCIYVYIHMYAYIYIYMCVYIYIYISLASATESQMLAEIVKGTMDRERRSVRAYSEESGDCTSLPSRDPNKQHNTSICLSIYLSIYCSAPEPPSHDAMPERPLWYNMI